MRKDEVDEREQKNATESARQNLRAARPCGSVSFRWSSADFDLFGVRWGGLWLSTAATAVDFVFYRRRAGLM
jgi:hypothetical protein